MSQLSLAEFMVIGKSFDNTGRCSPDSRPSPVRDTLRFLHFQSYKTRARKQILKKSGPIWLAPEPKRQMTKLYGVFMIRLYIHDRGAQKFFRFLFPVPQLSISSKSKRETRDA